MKGRARKIGGYVKTLLCLTGRLAVPQGGQRMKRSRRNRALVFKGKGEKDLALAAHRKRFSD